MKNRILNAFVLSISLAAFPALAATPDGLITSKAKLSLWTNAGVRSSTVHVDTNDGVITLYGKVPSSEQKALAEKTARGVMDVRDVKNLLQVVAVVDEKFVAKADKEVQAAVEKQLKADPALKDSAIAVKSVDKGAVLLTGTAKTFSDHVRAVGIADRVPGVLRVTSDVKSPDIFGNDERVTYSSKPDSKPMAEVRSSATDMRISAAVKLRLWTAAQIPSTEISVDTDDGVVTLFGMVPTAAVKTAAATEAAKAKGVTRIQNQLEIVASSQRASVEAKDADISRDLALVFKDRLELKGVTAAVKNGTVRLTGTVNSGWEEVTAVRLARQCAGVRGVEDQIKVDEKAYPETTRRD